MTDDNETGYLKDICLNSGVNAGAISWDVEGWERVNLGVLHLGGVP
jgi:hypothetical protein